MSLLIAEILGLLLLAALFGGALVYWWVRRNFVDVSSEYSRYERTMAEAENLRRENTESVALISGLEAERAQLQARLDTELAWRGKVESRLDDLAPVSLDPVLNRLHGVEESVDKLRPLDLGGVEKKLAALSSAVEAIESPDVSRLESDLASTSAAIAAFTPTDLRPLKTKLDGIDKRVAGLKNTDLAPVDARIKRLTDSVSRMELRIKDLRGTDLSPVNRRLDAIEKVLKRSSMPPAKPRPKRKAAPKRVRPGALLKSASFGDPDDLKKISGVGPKLEKMLNQVGVYYFFQVGEWKRPDVKHVDDLLSAFKGRIERDDWVRQARQLARQPDAARMS